MSRLEMHAMRIAFIAIGLLAVAGCTDYLDRREGVSMSGGDAQAINAATHIINPLPPHAADQQLLTNGQMAQKSIQNYRTGKVAEVSAPATE